jgi:hypothetical protein
MVSAELLNADQISIQPFSRSAFSGYFFPAVVFGPGLTLGLSSAFRSPSAY